MKALVVNAIDRGFEYEDVNTSVGFELDADLKSVLLAVAGAVGEHDRKAG